MNDWYSQLTISEAQYLADEFDEAVSDIWLAEGWTPLADDLLILRSELVGAIENRKLER